MFCPSCNAPAYITSGTIRDDHNNVRLDRFIVCTECAMASQINGGLLEDVGLTLADLQVPFTSIDLTPTFAARLQGRRDS